MIPVNMTEDTAQQKYHTRLPTIHHSRRRRLAVRPRRNSLQNPARR